MFEAFRPLTVGLSPYAEAQAGSSLRASTTDLPVCAPAHGSVPTSDHPDWDNEIGAIECSQPVCHAKYRTCANLQGRFIYDAE